MIIQNMRVMKLDRPTPTDNTLQKTDVQTFQASFAIVTLYASCAYNIRSHR
jgi:hypothetical protein